MVHSSRWRKAGCASAFVLLGVLLAGGIFRLCWPPAPAPARLVFYESKCKERLIWRLTPNGQGVDAVTQIPVFSGARVKVTAIKIDSHQGYRPLACCAEEDWIDFTVLAINGSVERPFEVIRLYYDRFAMPLSPTANGTPWDFDITPDGELISFAPGLGIKVSPAPLQLGRPAPPTPTTRPGTRSPSPTPSATP